MRRAPKITTDELQAAIADAYQQSGPINTVERPPGSFTFKDFQEATGLGSSACKDRLKRLVEEGKYERMRCTGRDSIGRTCIISCYQKKK